METKEPTRLSERQMLDLAQIYQKHECLWKVTDNLYKNRNAREEAYRQICERLNISGLTPADIPQKIKNLRSSYYAEMKRIEKSMRCGAKKRYIPKVSWFPVADKYLKNFWRKREFSAVQMKASSTLPENVSDEDSGLHNSRLTDKTETSEHSTNEPWLFISADSDQTLDNTHSVMDSKSHLPTRKKHKHGIHNLKNDTIYQKIMAKMDKISNNINMPLRTEDEFDIFGKYIAATLRTLPWETSIIAKMELQKTLSEIQLQAMRQESINPLGHTRNEDSSGIKKNESSGYSSL